MHSGYTVEVHKLPSGSSTSHYEELFETAWHEYEELQGTPCAEWCRTARRCIVDSPRWEVVLRYQGEVVGGLILEDDWDLHVGVCLGIRWGYVLPQHRGNAGSELYRTAIYIAKRNGYPYLAYSHRRAPWEYIIKYRRM